MKKIITILFLVTGALSCTKEANIKLPEQVEKLVVSCFISPSDTVLTAVVRTSSPKYNSGNHNVTAGGLTDAEVTISSDQGTAVFKYDNSFACYTLSPVEYPIFAGRKYSLTVRTPDGKHTSANTTVPADTLTIGHFAVDMNYNADSSRLDISTVAEVTALSGHTNYVGLYYRQIYVPKDTTFYGFNPEENRGYGIFDDDEKAPRKTFVFQSRDGGYQGESWFRKFRADFWVLNCSKEFYLYNRSVQLASEANDNPFGDPVMVYTNMDNGFGCFGAYQLSKRTFSQ